MTLQSWDCNYPVAQQPIEPSQEHDDSQPLPEQLSYLYQAMVTNYFLELEVLR